MRNEIDAMVIDTKQGQIKQVKIANDAETLMKVLQISSIPEVVGFKLDGKMFDFVFDDDFLNKKPLIPSVLDGNGQTQIFGNCLICHTEPSEEQRIKTSLSDKHIQEVKDSIDFYITKKTIGNKSETISTPVVVVDKVY